MSLPYLHPYLGLSNGLNTLHAAGGGGAGGIGGWVELARTTAGGGGSDVVVSSLSDKRYYMVLSSWTMSTNAQSRWRFNNDTGTNYAGRVSSNGGADSTVTSQVAIPYNNPGFDLTPHWNVGYIANRSANEKLWINHQMNQNTAGATNAPGRQEQACKWSNTSNAINEIRLNSSAGTYNSGSELVVLGWDPADSHTNNFWEELASVSGTNVASLDTGTITAKKYLWIQIVAQNVNPGENYGLQFNGDSGSNYSFRLSPNGTAEVTLTSYEKCLLNYSFSDVPTFTNIFVINTSANEKLVIAHGVSQNTTGATNVPQRLEWASKWANTSAQITDIQTAQSAGNITGEMKVWGAD
jgi:hypothetical protein